MLGRERGRTGKERGRGMEFKRQFASLPMGIDAHGNTIRQIHVYSPYKAVTRKDMKTDRLDRPKTVNMKSKHTKYIGC